MVVHYSICGGVFRADYALFYMRGVFRADYALFLAFDDWNTTIYYFCDVHRW